MPDKYDYSIWFEKEEPGDTTTEGDEKEKLAYISTMPP